MTVAALARELNTDLDSLVSWGDLTVDRTSPATLAESEVPADQAAQIRRWWFDAES